MHLRTITATVLVCLLAASPALAGYTAGGTFVVKTELGTIVDNGGVVCEGTDGDGVGGGCLPFPDASSGREVGFVRVYDNAAAHDVAFQVCIDNNGDGVCGGPQLNEVCRDQIFFSHDDSGRFFNPLGPLPASRLRECQGNGGHNGYVVLLCQGAHEVNGTAHTHSLSAGSIGLATSGDGYGDFCGGGFGGTPSGFGNFAAKAYRVV